MMKKILLILLWAPIAAMAQTDTIAHGLYKWKEPGHSKKISSEVIFEGTTHDFEWMQMKANKISSSAKQVQQVNNKEELLIIVKQGILYIGLKDSVSKLVSGSIVLLMPGEKFSLNNDKNAACTFYSMRYKAKLPANRQRADTAGASLVVDWNKLPVKTNARGFRRDFFDRPTALCRRFEMHVTTLKEGLNSHDPHRHPHEEIILNIDNKTEMLIGDKTYKGEAGDLYFLTSGIFHGVKNDGKGLCSYFAFRFE